MTPCRTCGGDRYAEPDERLAYVRYWGTYQEPSITFPVPCPGMRVVPVDEIFENILLARGSHRNEVVALPPRRWMRVSVWAAIFLAGARQRQGPWVDVRLTPRAWREVRTRAPWLTTAREAVRLVDPEILRGFRECEVRPYREEEAGHESA